MKDIGENDLLVPTTSRDPVAELRSSGKPLLIPDFVTNPTYGSIQGSESELGTHGDSKLVIRGGKAKPRPETITLAQWISANSRILSKMITDGNTDSNKILQYLEYCEKFGDFAQACEVESVMVYDNEYRKWQYDKSAEWGQDNTHLTLYYLRRKKLYHPDEILIRLALTPEAGLPIINPQECLIPRGTRSASITNQSLDARDVIVSLAMYASSQVVGNPIQNIFIIICNPLPNSNQSIKLITPLQNSSIIGSKSSKMIKLENLY